MIADGWWDAPVPATVAGGLADVGPEESDDGALPVLRSVCVVDVLGVHPREPLGVIEAEILRDRLTDCTVEAGR